MNNLFKNRKKAVLFFVPPLILICAFFLYTYSQIDLNLTLSSNQGYQQIQRMLIELGYFQRPLSTWIYFLLLTGLCCMQGFILYACQKKMLSWQQVIVGIFCVYIIASLSYPAFSHDLFNYMFDARIITHYNLSPYEYKALDFPEDSWVRFMHWTHRYYPYGPFWLVLTVPLSWLGLGKFTLTLGLFKVFFFVSSVMNVYLLYNILKKLKRKNPLIILVVYAMNPLIMTESLMSPHIDSVMWTFTLISFRLILENKKKASWIFMLLAGGIKYISLIYIPLLLRTSWIKQKYYFHILCTLTCLILIPIMLLREAYPWYIIPVIGFALLSGSPLLSAVSVGLTIILNNNYVKFLYFGNYELSIPLALMLGLLSLSVLYGCGIFYMLQKSRNSV